MSDTEKTNTEAEEAVKGGLFAALGGFEREKSQSPEEPQTPDPTLDPKEPKEGTQEPQNEPKDDVTPDDSDDPKEEPAVKLSAKDLRVKKREPSKAKPEPTPTLEAPTKPTEPTPEPKEEKPDYSHLPKRERETLELLEFGESKELADKGVSKKVLEYYEGRSKLLEELQQENYDDDEYDPKEDPKYRAWARKNKPPVDVDQLEDIRQERLISKAEERALERLRKEREEQDKEWKEYMEAQERERVRPEIEREVSTFSDNLLSSINEEVTKAYSDKKDWAAVEEDMPIEAPIVRQVLNEYTDKAEVLVSVASGAIKMDPRNRVHADLQKFVSSQADHFIKKGPEKTTRQGKAFVHPRDFKNPETQWTFDKDDMVGMLSKAAKIVAEQRISKEKKKFEALLKRQGISSSPSNDSLEDDVGGTGVKPSASGKASDGAKPKRRSLMDIL